MCETVLGWLIGLGVTRDGVLWGGTLRTYLSHRYFQPKVDRNSLLKGHPTTNRVQVRSLHDPNFAPIL